jgi:hypothetical protein
VADDPAAPENEARAPNPKPGRMRRVLRVVLIVYGLLFVPAVLGATVGLVKSFGAVGGESVEPSQKARVLAEGISEAMNGAVFAMLIAVAGGIVFGVYRLVTRRRGGAGR